MPITRLLTLDDQLCFSLYATSMAVTRAYKPSLDRLGLTYPQYLVLHALWDEDVRTIGAIAERLALESSTVTPLVKRLEAAGLVTRQRDVADERRVHVRLTGKGRAMRVECAQLIGTLLEKSGMTLDQLAGINRQVQELRNALALS